MYRNYRGPFVLLLLLAAALASPAWATTFVVNTTSDTVDANLGNGICADAGGDCSLRAAIMEAGYFAGGPHTVSIPAGTYTLSIAGRGEDSAATGDLDIFANMTITGAGADQTIIDANGIDRVFEIPFFSPVATISDLAITGGDPDNEGGGIRNYGHMTVLRCDVYGNTADGTKSGGGIFSTGELTVADSTIRENSSTLWGGGIGSFCFGGFTSNVIRNSTISGNSALGDLYNFGRGGGYYAGCSAVPLSLSNVTVANNSATGWGGGIAGGEISMKNSILASNTAPIGSDCNDTVTSLGYNLVGDSTGCDITATTGDMFNTAAHLEALADNGGPTKTHAIPVSSPAFDGGDPDGCKDAGDNSITADQRGISRPQAARCDMGSFELDDYPETDLSISKTDGETAVAGSSVTYTIEVTNEGPDDATGVTVVESPGAGLTFVSGTGGCAGGFPWVIGALGDNAMASCTATFSVSPGVSDGASIDNTVSVSGDGYDSASENDESTASTTVSREVDLAVGVGESVDPVVRGSGSGNLVYTVTLAQNGPSDASDVTVDLTTTLPAGVTIDSVVPSTGSYTAPTWTVPALAAAGSATLTVTLTVDGTTALGTDVIALGAAVTGAAETLINTGDDTDSEATSVASPADVSATKSVDGVFRSGGNVIYTIVLTNDGPGTQLDNPGNEFVDVLPSELTLVSANATSGSTVATVATNTVTWNGSIPSGGTVTITIQATIDGDVDPGTTVTNQGTVNYDSDGDGENDASAPTQGAGGGATAFDLALPAVPALDAAGLAALLLLLAVVGVIALRR
jgi:uncharacterized repeat protein (TIGR01451 family)/CSLREA domain-containing protein